MAHRSLVLRFSLGLKFQKSEPIEIIEDFSIALVNGFELLKRFVGWSIGHFSIVMKLISNHKNYFNGSNLIYQFLRFSHYIKKMFTTIAEIRMPNAMLHEGQRWAKPTAIFVDCLHSRLLKYCCKSKSSKNDWSLETILGYLKGISQRPSESLRKDRSKTSLILVARHFPKIIQLKTSSWKSYSLIYAFNVKWF